MANLWFRNHEADITTRAALQTSLTEVFGRPAVWKLRAEQQLRSRDQLPGENFTSYIEDVVNLCNRLNPSMSEDDKIKHILNGIEDDAFQMLFSKNPQTVSDVISLYQSYDELLIQRLITRRSSSSNDTLSSLTLGGPTPLLQHIQQFVREEVARHLSLVTCPSVPPISLPPPLQRVRSRLPRSCVLSNRPPLVTALLT